MPYKKGVKLKWNSRHWWIYRCNRYRGFIVTIYFKNSLKEYIHCSVACENSNMIYVLKNGGNSESSFLWNYGLMDIVYWIETEENLLNGFENEFTGSMGLLLVYVILVGLSFKG